MKPKLLRLFPSVLATLLAGVSLLLGAYLTFLQPPTPAYKTLNHWAVFMSPKDFLRLAAMDLNAATQEQLVKIPGIGETLAGRILDYREEHGPFDSVEEADAVKGIGPAKIRALGEYTYVKK